MASVLSQLLFKCPLTLLLYVFQTMLILEPLVGSTTGCAASVLLNPVTRTSLRACLETTKFAVFRRIYLVSLRKEVLSVIIHRILFTVSIFWTCFFVDIFWWFHHFNELVTSMNEFLYLLKLKMQMNAFPLVISG